MNMERFSRVLWRNHLPIAEACLATSFVQRLGDGSLPRDSFAAYVAQDAFFLDAFARAYALAAAAAPDRAAMQSFASLLDGALKELELHRGYAARWGIDLDRIAPHPAALAYTTFLLATAKGGNAVTTCAAMTPCMRLYAWLGAELRRAHPDAPHEYAEWIRTYSDPGFHDLAASIEALMDRLGGSLADLAPLYRRAMELELGFFEAFSPE